MNERVGGPSPEDAEFNTEVEDLKTRETIMKEHLERSLREIKEGTTEMNIVEQIFIILVDLMGLEAASSVEFDHLDDGEILGLAFTILIENGIDDPEEFLKEKGVLE